MNYRARIVSGEAAANGDIHLDVWIEKEAETDSWEPVPNGHRTLVLDGSAVLTITGDEELSDQEKLAALAELFRREAASWGIDKSDDAYTQLTELLPNGWPVTVNLAPPTRDAKGEISE